MVTVFCPRELPLLDGLGNAHTYCPRVRAATTSVLVHTVMNHVTGLLEKDGLLGTKSEQLLSFTVLKSPFCRNLSGLMLSLCVRRVQEHRDAFTGLFGSVGIEWIGLQCGRV